MVAELDYDGEVLFWKKLSLCALASLAGGTALAQAPAAPSQQNTRAEVQKVADSRFKKTEPGKFAATGTTGNTTQVTGTGGVGGVRRVSWREIE